MKLERPHGCPLRIKNAETGEMHPCAQLACEWFIELKGDNPQDAKDHISEWGCAVVWAVPAMLQVAKDVRKGTGGIQASTESFRNEMMMMNGRQVVEPPRIGGVGGKREED